MRSSTRTTLAGFFLAAAALAQGKELPRVTVKCIDGDGKPVAGAEVHLFQHRKSPDATRDYEPSGPHRSDANGFAVTAIAIDYDGGRFDRWLHARVPGKLVGALRWARFDDSPIAEPVIRMAPSREVRGRVQVPDGIAASSVRVRTLSVSALDDSNPFGTPLPRYAEFVGLRRTLPDVFDADVADDGTFVLRDVPGRPLLYLAAEGEGLAQAQWFNALLPERRIPDVVEMAMAREAVAAGTVLGPGGKPLPDAAITLRIDGNASFGVKCAFEVRSDAEGRFRIGGLPAGEFQLTALHAAGVMRPLDLQLAAAQHEAGLRVLLEEGIEVRGIVVGLPDRVGLERVGVVAITETTASGVSATARPIRRDASRCGCPGAGRGSTSAACRAATSSRARGWTGCCVSTCSRTTSRSPGSRSRSNARSESAAAGRARRPRARSRGSCRDTMPARLTIRTGRHAHGNSLDAVKRSRSRGGRCRPEASSGDGPVVRQPRFVDRSVKLSALHSCARAVTRYSRDTARLSSVPDEAAARRDSLKTSSIEHAVRTQPPAAGMAAGAPRKRRRSRGSDHRLYRRTQTGVAILILVYVSVAAWRESKPGHSELFPIASWSLFSLVPNSIEDFSVRILEVDGKPLARAPFFEEVKPIFCGATDHDARVVIERFGLAVATGRCGEAEQIRRRFEAEYLGKQAHQVRYELVARMYDPMERWHAGAFKSVRTLAAYAMGPR